MNIDQYVLEKRQIINTELARILPENDVLSEAARYTILSPSNRWRPIITIATAEMYDVPQEEVLHVACAIESLHGASIMLDDLPSFDNAMLRRGKPTLHMVYGENVALLASFWIKECFAPSLLSLRKDVNIRGKLTDYFISTTDNMIYGEAKDMSSKNSSMGIDEILNMYEQKSGALYELSAVAGGIVGQANETELKHLAKYGKSMGTAYQILDDILDIESTPEQIGKDVGQDKNKPTLPKLIGIEASRIKAQQLMDESKKVLTYLSRKTDMLSELVDYIVLINWKITTPIVKFE